MMVAELGEGGKTWFIVNVFSSIVEGFAGCWGREKRKDNLDTKDSHLYTDREMPTMVPVGLKNYRNQITREKELERQEAITGE